MERIQTTIENRRHGKTIRDVIISLEINDLDRSIVLNKT